MLAGRFESDSKTLADRETDVFDMFVRLERLNRRGQWLSGELARRQVQDLPPKARIGLPAESLDLGDGYGLIHRAAFRLHAPTGVLALQDNRRGLGRRTLATYAGEASGHRGFQVDPILHTDVWRQMANLEIKRLSVQVARPENLRAIEPNDVTVVGALRALKSVVNAPEVVLELKVSRREKGLDQARARGLLRFFGRTAEDGGAGISRLKVAGRNPDEQQDVELDLLEAHIKEHKKLSLSNDIIGNYTQRDTAVGEAIDHYLDEIKLQFPDLNLDSLI